MLQSARWPVEWGDDLNCYALCVLGVVASFFIIGSSPMRTLNTNPPVVQPRAGLNRDRLWLCYRKQAQLGSRKALRRTAWESDAEECSVFRFFYFGTRFTAIVGCSMHAIDLFRASEIKAKF